MRKSLLPILLLAFFGVLAFLFSKPASVEAADCNEGYRRISEDSCKSVCTGGTCTLDPTPGPGPHWVCGSCPPPPAANCPSGTSTMDSFRDCSDNCTSGQCVDDSDGVNRCCVYFSGGSPSPNACPNGSSGYGTPTQCSTGCTGDCVGDAEGDKRCCLAAAVGTKTIPGIDLPEKEECIDIGIGLCIHTDPALLAQDILGIGIGIGTLLAVLFLIIGGFGVAASGGNPDNLEAAKKQITAAISGLLFILMSVIILSIIGGGVIGIDFFK